MGILALELQSAGQDAFVAYAPGSLENEGRFVLDGDAVVACELELDDRRVTFERRGP